MRLAPGRLKEMVEECRSQGRHVVCHEFLDDPRGYDVAGPAARGAVCRGSWDTIEHHQWLQVAERLGLIVWVDRGGPSDVESAQAT